MNYEKIGFKAGLEIHQQLDTHKLFCKCQSEITEDIDYSFKRFLRPTQSEMGDVDLAALAEAEKNRFFLYTASDKSTCLVEADEEPPHSANKDAIDICITIAVLTNCYIVDEFSFMRKIVIDGSNTGGFQRTGLIAIDGGIDDVGIQTVALEEDSARKITEKDKMVNYGLDRLGIPLIEIATKPEIKNPEHARDVAERIGMLLRATGKVKKGLGTIRQDLNISISEGNRVEIKGIQSLSSISRVAEKEVLRQIGVNQIKKILKTRNKNEKLDEKKIIDLTDFLKNIESNVITKLLKNDCHAKGFILSGFSGLLKQADTRLGREFAVHARLLSGIGGIIHSDELPGYGLNKKDLEKLKELFKAKKDDAFVIAIGKEKTVEIALDAVFKRAQTVFKGVTEEVRRALPDDTTEYMRPMPGAARMYPETDVKPITITKEKIKIIENNLPELPDKKHERFIREYLINNEQAKQILSSGYEEDFEKLVKKYPELRNVVMRTYLNTFSELEKENRDISFITDEMLLEVFSGLYKELYSKEAVPDILRYLHDNPGKTLQKAILECNLEKTDIKEIQKLAEKIVKERLDFVKKRGLGAVGPLMGLIMKELRGKADGKVISSILKNEIEKVI
jgi:glutamyl-tRNA(Gln) amidotransferase subunit E